MLGSESGNTRFGIREGASGAGGFRMGGALGALPSTKPRWGLC